jgi:predicted HTH transcriptional regulator
LELEFPGGDGATREDELLKFCEVPRKRIEIAGLLDIRAAKHYARINARYLTPLIEQGKLKTLYPDAYPMECQLWASDLSIKSMQEEIIEFCREPKTKLEIKTRFGLSRKTYLIVGADLVTRGIISQIYPTAGESRFQKYQSQPQA